MVCTQTQMMWSGWVRTGSGSCQVQERVCFEMRILLAPRTQQECGSSPLTHKVQPTGMFPSSCFYSLPLNLHYNIFILWFEKKNNKIHSLSLPAIFAPISSMVLPTSLNKFTSLVQKCAKFPHIGFATVQRSVSNNPFWPLCLYFFEHLPLQSYTNRSNRKRVRNQESLHPVPFTDQQVSPFSISIIYHI